MTGKPQLSADFVADLMQGADEFIAEMNKSDARMRAFWRSFTTRQERRRIERGGYQAPAKVYPVERLPGGPVWKPNP